MPVQEFALDQTGANRVQIFQGNNGEDITILVNKSIIGSISNRQELEFGRQFMLKDGSSLTIRSVKNQYLVLKNGQPLPFMSDVAVAVAEANIQQITMKEEVERRTLQMRIDIAKTNAGIAPAPPIETNPSTVDLPIGAIIAAVGTALSLIAFFMMPYVTIGPFSFTALQIASGNINGVQVSWQPLLWLEPIIAVALLIIALTRFMRSKEPMYDGGVAPMTILLILASLTLLFLLAKFFLFDNQPVLPHFTPVYGAGYWVYMIGLAITIVGGVIHLRTIE